MAVIKPGQSTGNKGGVYQEVGPRGGKQPNYDAESVATAAHELGKAGLVARVMVDMSHANSSKEYARQMRVADDIASQISAGDDRIFGVMVESHLNPGRQDLVPGKELVYGQSITDGCIGWDDSAALLHKLAAAVRARRLTLESKIA